VTGLYYALTQLPQRDPLAPLVGVGLGHYSSRAALILSGEYLTSNVSFLPQQESRWTRLYVTPLWNRRLTASVANQGNANEPFSSLQSIYTEFGVVVLGALLVAGAVFIRAQLRTRSRLGYASILSIITFAGACCFDNYMEQPKVTIPLLLFWLVGAADVKLRDSRAGGGSTPAEATLTADT
jgi:hypothetical protein